MTEEEQGEVQTGEEGTTAPPVPDVSSSSDVAGSETLDVADLVKRLDGFDEKLSALDKLEDMVDARVKSVKDTSINKLLAYADDIESLVTASGGDLEKIRPQLESRALDDRLGKIEAQLGSDSAVGTATGDDLQTSTTKFLNDKQNELGVTLSDEELQELIDSRRWPSSEKDRETEWYGALTTLLVKKVKQGDVSSAATVGSGESVPASSASDDDLVTEINELQKHPMKDVERRQRLIAEAKERGIF